jgi:hypothetical protein
MFQLIAVAEPPAVDHPALIEDVRSVNSDTIFDGLPLRVTAVEAMASCVHWSVQRASPASLCGNHQTKWIRETVLRHWVGRVTPLTSLLTAGTPFGLPKPGQTRVFAIIAARRADGDEVSTAAFLKAVTELERQAVREDLPVVNTIHFRQGTLTRSDRTLARFFQYLRATRDAIRQRSSSYIAFRVLRPLGSAMFIRERLSRSRKLKRGDRPFRRSPRRWVCCQFFLGIEPGRNSAERSFVPAVAASPK